MTFMAPRNRSLIHEICTVHTIFGRSKLRLRRGLRDFCNVTFILLCASILIFFIKAINGKIPVKTRFLKFLYNYGASTLKFITLIRRRD